MSPPDRARDAVDPDAGGLERIAAAFTRFAERWVPDAFAFALIGTMLAVLGALFVGAAPGAVVDAWGKGFFSLLAFTMQMSLVIISGSVLAEAPPVARLVRRLASLPSSSRGAVALVALASMAASWLNWGFGLIFAAVLAQAVARRLARVDYRALAASSLLGTGSVWAQGLSGSAALQMSTPPLAPAIRDAAAHGGVLPGGIIPLAHTIFLWQSVVSVLCEMVVVTAVMWLAAPPEARARSAADLGIALPPPVDEPAEAGPVTSLNERLERSRLLGLLVVLLGGAALVRELSRASHSAGGMLGALNINTINLAFLLTGFALHGTPARFLAAVRRATPSVWGVVVQFPFYGAIAGVIADTHLGARIAHAFVSVSSPASFPALMASYSAALGVLVPSGGGKWILEAPYVLVAAHDLRVHLGWVVACYDLGEALSNLLQPFWMLPTLALLGLRARDVMGYTFVVFLALAPLVLALVTLLGRTLAYPL